MRLIRFRRNDMDLVTLLVGVIIFVLAIWLVRDVIPFKDATIRTVLIIVIVVLFILWLLGYIPIYGPHFIRR